LIGGIETGERVEQKKPSAARSRGLRQDARGITAVHADFREVSRYCVFQNPGFMKGILRGTVSKAYHTYARSMRRSTQQSWSTDNLWRMTATNRRVMATTPFFGRDGASFRLAAPLAALIGSGD
jgi:hypothetical protein